MLKLVGKMLKLFATSLIMQSPNYFDDPKLFSDLYLSF